MNWKSYAKQIAVGLVIMALGAYLARSTKVGQKLFGTTQNA